MISVKVKLFGPLREIVRSDELIIEVPESCSGDELFEKLSSKYPELRKWKQSVRLAVNLEYALSSQVIHAGDDIAFIPPVSGG